CRAERPGISASLGERLEEATRERLAPLLAGDVSRFQTALGRCPRDDIFVQVEIAEPLRDQLSDLIAARPRRMRQTHHTASHRADARARSRSSQAADRGVDGSGLRRSGSCSQPYRRRAVGRTGHYANRSELTAPALALD